MTKRATPVMGTALLCAALVLNMGGCGSGSESAQRSPAPEEQVFDMLDEYGTWTEMLSYGAVWRPNVAPEWRPYTYGHWVWSDEGWVWIGYEPFAWVVYHYGSWYDDQRLGWVWVPAYDWSPARVNWAYSDNTVGWSPIAPPGAPEYLPGDPFWAQTWVVVPIDNFSHDNVGVYNVSKDPVRGSTRGSTARPPQPKEIQSHGAPVIRSLRVDEETVSHGGRNLVRLKLPAEEEQQIKAHEAEVNREILSKNPSGGTRGVNPAGGTTGTPVVSPVKKVDEPVPGAQPQPQPVRKEIRDPSVGVGKAAKPAVKKPAVERKKTEVQNPTPVPVEKKPEPKKEAAQEKQAGEKSKTEEPAK